MVRTRQQAGADNRKGRMMSTCRDEDTGPRCRDEYSADDRRGSMVSACREEDTGPGRGDVPSSREREDVLEEHRGSPAESGPTEDTDGQSSEMLRQSHSWSQGDGSQSQDQAAVSTVLQGFQEQISSLENSIKHVTSELTNVIRNMNSGSLGQNRNNSQGEQGPVAVPSRPSIQRRGRNTHRSNQEYESDSEYESNTYSNSSTNIRVREHNSPKLPPFTGKEAWNIWFNRFEDVANRQRWSLERRLDEILPRLQGAAGEFAYGQLSQADRSNYRHLCKELASRFRVVETTRAFQAQFSRRNQKYGESVEDYAADLKKLYDKAHLHRDKETRREDLLRRFLDGLVDDDARFHVEFTKEPVNIDDAVYQTVSFQETRQRMHGHERHDARAVLKPNNLSDQNENEVARVAPGKNKNRLIQNDNTVDTDQKEKSLNKASSKESFDLDKLREIVRSELESIITPSQDQTTLNQYNKDRNHGNRQPMRLQSDTYSIYRRRNERRRQDRACFLCGETTHFKRDCPKLQKTRGNNSAKQSKQDLN